jgi:predicted transposase YbfD/YdcC
MLVLASCAVLCGAEGWEDSEAYGTALAEWCEAVLDLPHGMPCDDTFRRVLSRLDPNELTPCFLSWSEALSDMSKGDLVSRDGTTLRHAFDHAASTAAMHMVSAWAHANRLGLGQLTVEAKSNEITAIPKLLPLLDLQGAPVTMEAMGCQKEIAQAMTEQGAEYVLALKENHYTLYDDVALFWDDATATDCAAIAHACVVTVDGDHGRMDTHVRGDIRYCVVRGEGVMGPVAQWRDG